MKYLTFTLLLLSCGPALRPPCNTLSLEAQYQADMALQCPNLPAAECPYADEIGDDFEQKVIDQCSN